MRNLSWKMATEMARRNINIKKYHHYNDVWLPKDLAQGDIIRCDLLTDVYQNGEPEVCPRNCLLLGIDLNKETMEIDALRVLRFSYYTLDHNDKTEMLIHPRDIEYRGRISGFRDQVVLRTGRVDVVPVESTYMGFYMDRIGRMDPTLFPQVEDSLKKAKDSGKFYFKIHEGAMLSNNVTVPSLDPEKFGRHYTFTMPAKSAPAFKEMDADTRGDFLRGAESARLSMDLARVLRIQVEHKAVKDMTAREREERLALRRVMNALSKPASFRLTQSFARVIDNAVSRLNSLEGKYEEKMKEEPFYQAGNKLGDIPDYRSLLRRHFGLEGGKQDAPPRAVIKQQLDQGSLKDLQTLGVGGLLREPTIRIPEHIWRGRYVMMRIPNLLDPEDMGNAFRPCAIWKAYAKSDEEGNPVLAGFELHPCTRESAHAFNFKMKVRPLDTSNKQPSFLIADMVIRAPLNSMYFQPDQREDFYYELLPNQIKDFDMKRGLAEQDARGVKTYGLAAVPNEWTELELPEAPDEKLRQRLIDWNKARFPVSAPDIRPMRASRNTARNFQFTV